MKLSRAWLGELVDLAGVSAEQVAETLTFHVAEVEGVEHHGAGLDAVKTARVLTAIPHPKADRLNVCTVDAGDGVVRTVVCGAPTWPPVRSCATPRWGPRCRMASRSPCVRFAGSRATA